MKCNRNIAIIGNAVEIVAGIQVLRAVAVLVVTICHAQFEVSRVGELPAAVPAATPDGLAIFGVLIVAGASLPRPSLKGPFWSPVMVIGSASYALYLFHAIPMRTLFLLARCTGFDLQRATLAYVCGAVPISILLAIAIYCLVVRPLLKPLRWRNAAKSSRLKVGDLDQSAVALVPEFQVHRAEDRS